MSNIGILWYEVNSKVIYHLENKYDSSGNDKTLTSSGITFVPAKFGYGAKTAASTNRLYRSDAAGIDSDGDLSIMFWVKFATLPTSGNTATLFVLREFNACGHYLKLKNTSGVYSLRYELNSDIDGLASADVTIAIDEWHLVAATFSAARAMKLYLDGCLIASDTAAAGTDINTSLFSIGHVVYILFIPIGYSPLATFDELHIFQEVKTDEWLKKYFVWATGKLV